MKQLNDQIDDIGVKIGLLQTELNTLTKKHAKLKECHGWTRWRADEGERYCFAFSDGTVSFEFETGSGEDERRYLSGNYFETEIEAEMHFTRQLATQRVKDRIAQLNEAAGWKWDDTAQRFWSFAIDPTVHRYAEKVTGWSYSAHMPVDLCGPLETIERVIQEMPYALRLMFGLPADDETKDEE